MKVHWYAGWRGYKVSGIVIDYVAVWGTVKAIVRVTATEDKSWRYDTDKLAVVCVDDICIDA